METSYEICTYVCTVHAYITITYCYHGGIDVVSGIVGRTASNVEVVGGVCMQWRTVWICSVWGVFGYIHTCANNHELYNEAFIFLDTLGI